MRRPASEFVLTTPYPCLQEEASNLTVPRRWILAYEQCSTKRAAGVVHSVGVCVGVRTYNTCITERNEQCK
jgi:hypothetical protein